MTPAHESLLNHASVRGVTCCHPMSGRYCAVGRELWIDDKVQAVLDETSLEARRYLLEQMARNMPQWLDEIKRRVADRFGAHIEARLKKQGAA